MGWSIQIFQNFSFSIKGSLFCFKQIHQRIFFCDFLCFAIILLTCKILALWSDLVTPMALRSLAPIWNVQKHNSNYLQSKLTFSIKDLERNTSLSYFSLVVWNGDLQEFNSTVLFYSVYFNNFAGLKSEQICNT